MPERSEGIGDQLVSHSQTQISLFIKLRRSIRPKLLNSANLRPRPPLPESSQTQQTMFLIALTGLRQLRSIQEDSNELKFNSDKFELTLQQLSALIRHVRIDPKSALPHSHQPSLLFQIHFTSKRGHWAAYKTKIKMVEFF
jgi:hypothetical protein